MVKIYIYIYICKGLNSLLYKEFVQINMKNILAHSLKKKNKRYEWEIHRRKNYDGQ